MTKDMLWGKVADSLKESDLELKKIDKDVGYIGWNYKAAKIPK